MKRLKNSHYDVLSRLAAQGEEGRVRRLPGGFWTDDRATFEYQEGEWHTTKPIIDAMLTAQLLESDGQQFKMTPQGEEALRTGVYPC